MRRQARTDRNHAEIRDGLRRVTVVEDLSDVGRGIPDLLARHLRGYPVLLEVKDPGKPPSARKLTSDEQACALRWGSAYRVVLTLDDALRAIGAISG
jgi:hypothetical protein